MQSSTGEGMDEPDRPKHKIPTFTVVAEGER
jgi:hypothetical protein